MSTSRIRSMHVGAPAMRWTRVRPSSDEWYSAFGKSPVNGPVWYGREGLAGDVAKLRSRALRKS